eukprot:jgi/Chrzof1/2822/Cz12g00040.t1
MRMYVQACVAGPAVNHGCCSIPCLLAGGFCQESFPKQVFGVCFTCSTTSSTNPNGQTSANSNLPAAKLVRTRPVVFGRDAASPQSKRVMVMRFNSCACGLCEAAQRRGVLIWYITSSV